ncbi:MULTISPECIES: PilZ domain-containing protein [unclassified Bradyrhizobium]|uniref:PilZ domain-containing protein n=1 Tax=unclassified Bradyrhizobium TaxID=2631580 RepID=UPI002FEF7144
MRWNNRKAARVHFECKHLVNIMGVDGTWRRSCTLLDVSDSGAKLEVEGSTDVLKTQEFFLVLSSTGMAFRRCELVWVNGAQAGVRFRTEKGKGHSGKNERLAGAHQVSIAGLDLG